ncbi:MAG: asparagine synthase (glutamine-hydrolyzing) [Gammaproteobacteria bacterium]
MCGIAGIWQSKGLRDGKPTLQAMAEAIQHRGPDDAGIWADEDAGIGFAHRRLSILDLSPAGHQPMVSACGRYLIVFNGEIYNHLELRRELDALALADEAPSHQEGRERKGITRSVRKPWCGHSDTETLLEALSQWGVRKALERCVGVFAFALWDRQQRMLILARDRIGEKPLYYGWQGNVFLFGSELKALRAYPGFRAEINRDALVLFLRHNYVPAPYTIISGIYKLPPGTYLTVSPKYKNAMPLMYWSAREVAERGQQELFKGTQADAGAELESLLTQAVAGQMVADVPLGAFLSGGTDSSAVVALMQAQSSRPVKTFTIGFWENRYNEAEYAKAIARHLGTDHTELYVTEEEARGVIPSLPVIYDEPFADSSQIPTYLVSKLARQQVTVSLSGDGGDELFGGYNRYVWATNIWRKLGWLPTSMRLVLAALLTSVRPQAWNSVFYRFQCFLPGRWRYANPGDKLHKLADMLAVKTPEEIYHQLVSHWEKPALVVVNGKQPGTVLTDSAGWAQLPDFAHRMMYLDLVSYLPDDILVKVDRAAMQVSLETRVPYLDHRVVEFAWRLPLATKIRNGHGKRLLRRVLYQYVPEALIERPKMGFGVPLDVWLRGALRSWAEGLLDEQRLAREGFFNPMPIGQKWAEHLGGGRNWAYHLWDVLMFQAWLERWGGAPPS